MTSVIAARDVAPGMVLAAAYDLATAPFRAATMPRRSLFDLPLGDGPAWTITEEPARPDGTPPERWVAVLPAWSAESEHDLTDEAFGFAAAARPIIALLPPNGYWFDARQSAVARYTRTGFEAAAVTAFAIESALRVSVTGMNRAAEVRFGHPYAVVAVASDARWIPQRDEIAYGPWHGMPVFSAWITEPDDATE